MNLSNECKKFRSQIFNVTYNNFNPIFKCDHTIEMIFNLLDEGAFPLYEKLKIPLKNKFTYTLKPFFIEIFYAVIIIICKVCLVN